MSRLQSRLTLKVWRASTAEDRRAAAQEIAAQSGGALELVRTAGEDEVPVFFHVPSQVLFHLVPGGTWRLGFSDSMERPARSQVVAG